MAQALVVMRTGGTLIHEVPDSSVSAGAAAARGADAAHGDGAPTLPAASIATPMFAPAAPSVEAAAASPAPALGQSSTAAALTLASASHVDLGSSDAVERSATFELPFTHVVAGSDDVTYITQDDGSIVVSDADVGSSDWTIIV